jgi:hypothetical protein
MALTTTLAFLISTSFSFCVVYCSRDLSSSQLENFQLTTLHLSSFEHIACRWFVSASFMFPIVTVRRKYASPTKYHVNHVKKSAHARYRTRKRNRQKCHTPHTFLVVHSGQPRQNGCSSAFSLAPFRYCDTIRQ